MEQKRDLAIVLRWVPFEELHRVLAPGGRTCLAQFGPQLASERLGLRDAALESLRDTGWAYIDRDSVSNSIVTEHFVRDCAVGLFAVEAYRPITYGWADVYVLRRLRTPDTGGVVAASSSRIDGQGSNVVDARMV